MIATKGETTMTSTSISRRNLLAAGASVVVGLSAASRVGRAQASDAFVIAQSDDIQPKNIMPTRLANQTWVRNVFESLAYIDPETFEPSPLLATKWALSDDGLTMDMTLRGDVTFHTGRKMTADDAKFSVMTATEAQTAAQLGFVGRAITAINVRSATELTFTFQRPLANFFEFLERTPIVDRETYGKREDGNTIVGTGPYRFVGWTPGASIRLTRYSGYRDPKAAAIRDVELVIVKDVTALVSALRSGRAQMAYGILPADTVEFDGNPMFKVVPTGGSIYPFGVNVQAAPFDRKLVRQALGFAVDRERIVLQAFNGMGTPTSLFWQPKSPGYTDALAGQYGYDPAKARKMIEDAGAKDATVTITVHALPSQRSIFEIVQNNLKEVGLKVNANMIDVPSFGQRQIAGDLGQAFLQLHSLVGLSAATLLDAAPAIREGNASHFWNDEYVALRRAVQGARDTAQTAAAVEALSKYMNDEAFNLALLQAPTPTVVTSSLSGARYGLDGYIWLGGAKLA
jgi:peptide/nickel transport system substrate-binding protein